MSTADDDLLDGFLKEYGGADVLSALAKVNPAQEPSSGLRDRVLSAAVTEGRFARFASAVSEMLDLPAPAAQGLLDRLADDAVWSPGLIPQMQLCHVQGGPRVQGAITGFVRLESGATFPNHEHLGAEEILILQGSCLDSVDNKVLRVGDRVQMASGSAHSFDVRKGPDFLYLAVVFNGLRVNGQELLASDPRL